MNTHKYVKFFISVKFGKLILLVLRSEILLKIKVNLSNYYVLVRLYN